MPDTQPTAFSEEAVERVMQKYWDDWCADTGHVPPEFHIAGPRTTRVYADFRSSEMAHRIVEALSAATSVGGDGEYVMAWHDAVAQANEWASDKPMNSAEYRIVRRLIDARQDTLTTLQAKLLAAEGVVEAARDIDTACDLAPHGADANWAWCCSHHEWTPCSHFDLMAALATFDQLSQP
jgi:hypothetical protein